MLNILIVDDSEVDRLLMEGLLKQSIGFEVHWAENGIQALERLREWPIDMVVTDMQMPEMDGLELVRRVRESYPEIPIVLTTGVGSEDTASRALNDGAAGYVPKSHMNNMLVPTVRGVLNILTVQRRYNRLLNRSTCAHFEFQLENDPRHILPLVDFIEKMMRSMMRLDRINRLRIAIAFEQALHNAMFRGNLEIDSDYSLPFGDQEPPESVAYLIRDRLSSHPYKDRRISVSVELTRSDILIGVRDQGPGFDHQNAGSWDRSQSRGIILMKSFMDSVQYNEKGNEVTLRCSWPSGERKEPTAAMDAAADQIMDGQVGTGEPISGVQLGSLTCLKTGTVVSMSIEKFLIGRRESCHLVIPLQSVAAVHCALVRENDRWFVKNLDSQYSSRVNGQMVSYAELKSGDLIGIGNAEYRIEF